MYIRGESITAWDGIIGAAVLGGVSESSDGLRICLPAAVEI